MNDNGFNALANEHRRELRVELLKHNAETVTKPLPARSAIKPLLPSTEDETETQALFDILVVPRFITVNAADRLSVDYTL